MPFRLCNAPATFSRMGLAIFQPLEVQYPRRYWYYMDDFGTFMKQEEDKLYQEINWAFFKFLKENDLYLCPEKCVFKQPEMDFLRIHVKNEDISINPSKIASIKKYGKKLSNISEVQKFLGTVGY